MARQKEYIEEDVIEKATELFWRNGYESTSMRSLEKAMGINKFSIYSSFGSKRGVFLKSMNCYSSKLQVLFNKLHNSEKGVEAIKIFFYDFLEFSNENNSSRGCLLARVAGEIGPNGDAGIMSEVNKHANKLRGLFIEKLLSDFTKNESVIKRQANFLLVAQQGLTTAAKVFNRQQLEDYIETAFEKI